MISAQQLEQVLVSLLDHAVPKNLKPDNIARQLQELEHTYNIQLSEYGYVMYALEHAGLGGIYHGRLSDPMLLKSYAEEAQKYKEDLPTLLVNAKTYASKVFENVQDPEMCMMRLEGMSYPYVLFCLFAATGNLAIVEQYSTETRELLARYPGTLDKLPESFQIAIQEALADADIE